jgi:hypothetical protein
MRMLPSGSDRPGRPGTRMNLARRTGRAPEAATETAPMITPQPEPTHRRPRAVAIASGLWILLGILLVLIALVALPQGLADPTLHIESVLLAVALTGMPGVVFISLGREVGRGSNSARTGLTVFGALFSIFLLPLVITVPAIILQNLPSSKKWFAYKQAERRPPT